MGYLSLDGRETEFDDRTLAHLHIVIINRLRHGHSFAFSWKDTEAGGGGRNCVWLHPASNLRFHFSTSRTPSINREWLQQLAESAESSRGLVVLPEPRLDGERAPEPGCDQAESRPETARTVDAPFEGYART
ncbi:DUF7882 family protein [Leifsonia sp. 2MCAF36]|uniref:DUF7882 family protein n=1 Tax=Leifsonia sp. 2MCAF36 TaxID=3232988 RepID=UPI003F9991C9